MDRAERRRLVRPGTEPGPLKCLVCGNTLGRQGAPPAETFPLLEGHIHRDERCRSGAVRLYLESTGRIQPRKEARFPL